MANKILNDLPVCTTPAPGNWLLIETPSAAQKLDAAYLTSPTGAGAGLAAHLADPTAAHAATAVSFASAGSITSVNVQNAIEELNLDHTSMMLAHETMAMDSHPASSITFTPTPTLTATDAQTAIEQAASGVAVGSLSASGVTFATTVEIGATNVQAAIVEVQTEAAAALAAQVAALQVAAAAMVPAGSVFDYAGTAAPAGFLLMQGQAVTTADTLYPQLWAVVPAGWKSGTTLTLPDTRGRVTVGHSASDTDFDTIGESGGSKTHTLTQAQLPSATITIDPPNTSAVITDPGHVHGETWMSGTGGAALPHLTGNAAVTTSVLTNAIESTQSAVSNITAAVNIASFNSGPLGSGAAHPIVQPYIVMTKMIKVH